MHLPHHHHEQSEILIEHMPESENFQTVSALFRQLADPNRIRILWLLCHTEECVVNIAAIVGMSSPATVHHLKSLKEAGLIESRKAGKEVYYKASGSAESSALHIMIEEMMKISCPVQKKDSSQPHHDHNIHIHTATGGNAALARQVHDYLLEHPDKHISIEQLAKDFHINTTTLKKIFKDTYGKPIASYMKEYRMKEAARLLVNTRLEVGEIADRVGYSSHSKFSESFRQFAGMLPSEFRKSLD